MKSGSNATPRVRLLGTLVGATLAIVVGGAVAAPRDAAAPVVSQFRVHDLTRNDLGASEGDSFITRKQAMQDLDALGDAIEGNSSYIWSTTFPYRASIEGMKAALPAKVSINGLSTQVNKFVRLFGDDHAQVPEWTSRIPQGSLPFQFGKSDTRYFIFTLAPAGLVNPEFPYVRSIDGVLIDEWLRVAGDIGQGPYSSTAARESKGYGLLPYINYLRGEMGLPVKPDAVLEMVSENGRAATRMTVAVSPVPVKRTLGTFRLPNESRMLEGNIGYLRVPAHTGDKAAQFIETVDKTMAGFRDTDALIIDARMSGGGARRVLNSLFPYLMKASDKPYIFNVVKLRLPENDADFGPLAVFDDDAKRFLYVPNPANPANEAEAYREFAKSFIPAWNPPADKFSDWYFMTQRPRADKPHYDKPVYMLVDFGVGSAGDIFASAFKGWRSVTTLGTPTMGRSGQGVVFPLPNSKLGVNLSTMASFQKTGERYDTAGIHPDIVIEPVPTDWYGATDTVLDRARALAAAKLVEAAAVK
ncbi:S41 family peptidase [Thermomonas sp.]